MKSIQAQITDLFKQTFVQCGYDPSLGQVVDSQRPDLGQFQCNGALAAAKTAKKKPREVAEEIIARIGKNEMVGALSIAGPGFINISVDDTYLANHCTALNADPHLGCEQAGAGHTMIIDFGSPNIAKPMHVGHLRSAIIGDGLQRLFRFLGYRVISDNHVGDWGTQMGMLICELKREKPELIYFDESFGGAYPVEPPLSIQDLEAMYPRASKRCKEDESAMAEAVAATDALQKGRKGYLALWNHFVALSMQTLRNDFDSLGVSFDHWLGESFYQKQMERLVERLRSDGTAQVSEGALVIHVAEQGDAVEVPPVMLVKSGGGFLYSTSDMATIEYRVNHFNADTILYVVDQRQSLHFQQVFRAVRRTGIAGPRIVLEHVGFGTVNGTDGKPFKTRSGGVMKLSDLIEQVTVKADERMREAGIAQDLDPQEHRNTARMVGIAALKFADLLNHRLSNYVFDIDKFTRFEGKTGPYLLYSAVRIKSILRKAAEQGVHAGSLRAPSGEERRLMLLLCAVQDTIAEAVASYAPNYLCDFAYNLAQEFNRFYKDCHILREEDKQKQGSWLSLAQLCLKEFEVLLGLLGIEIPDRM